MRDAASDADAGLCAACTHARLIVSARGSSFWLCERSADDPRFAKYPRLPVLRCAGYEPGDRGAGGGTRQPLTPPAPQP